MLKHYIAVGERAYSPDEIINLIKSTCGSDIDFPTRLKSKKVDIAGYKVNVSSLRLRTFATKGTTCCKCGLKATHFNLEMTQYDAMIGRPPHFNLYGFDEDNEIVMLTQDHIIAKSNGGKDKLLNLQTMCSPCNNAKGSS
jgi:hypothetical protein